MTMLEPRRLILCTWLVIIAFAFLAISGVHVHPLIFAIGAAGAWTPTNNTRTNILGSANYTSDSMKIALLLSTSNIGAASTTYAALTNEVANGLGYLTGGITVSPGTLAGTTTVTGDITTDPVWTASGGSIVARFAVLYVVAGNVIMYCLLDSTPADVTVTTGNTLTLATPSGIFTLA
jgi:hypothetical protein